MPLALLARLEALLLQQDQQTAGERTTSVRRLTARRGDFHREGDVAGVVAILAEGLGYRYKQLPNGRRQIVGYLLPGDAVSFGMLRGEPLDHNVRLMQPSTIFAVQSPEPELLPPELSAMLLDLAARELSISQEWLSSVGQRDARARVAHLFCELYCRTRDLGLVYGGGFDFPASQEEIADSVGITPVHANRTLQSLRKDGLIAFDGRTLVVEDLVALAAAAMFQPDYLHLRGAQVLKELKGGDASTVSRAPFPAAS